MLNDLFYTYGFDNSVVATHDGIVTKVEVEKKIKGKSEWVELKELSSE